MIWLILAAALIALIFGPSLWVKRVMARYETPPDRYPSTGHDLARHLLDQHGLHHVTVERTEAGDHYDPMDKAVRLSTGRYDGHSLTAVTVAAHEVGHALQDAGDYQPLRLRTRLIQWLRPLEKVGAGILIAAPLLAVLARIPSVTAIMVIGGLLTLSTASVIHLITLPTELDASFTRAMPLLTADGILIAGDEPHARKILTAAALTYVAVSLMSLLNVARWWTLLWR